MALRVLIMIPCYNEEAALPALLSQLHSTLPPPGYEFELMVINDGSADNTAPIARSLGVQVLNLPVNLGVGGAVQTGLRYARQHHFYLAMQLDGDGQHPPDQIGMLLKHYEATGAALIIGSRFSGVKGYRSSIFRRMGIIYLGWLNRFFTGQRISDSTSGFRLFDRRAIRLGADYYPDDYPEPESLIYFAKAGLPIAEVPVAMQARQGGRSSIRNFTSLYYCVKVSIAMLFSAIRKFY